MNVKNELLKKIKEKKELKDISDSLIIDKLDEFEKKKKISLKNLSKREEKIVVKEIRNGLRRLSGMFMISYKKRKKYFKEGNIASLLITHSSSKERMEFYPELRKRIEELDIHSILDLGCGLNPLALANEKITYYASDIKEDDLEIVRSFFKKNKIEGKVFSYDLENLDGNLPQADLCLIFKVLDIVSKNQWNITERILEKTNCKYYMISFAIKTLSGKYMKVQRRRWLENLLKKKNYEYSYFKTNNEIFYLVRKTVIQQID